MNVLRATLVAVLLVAGVVAGPARARQDDPRLDDLFDKLQSATGMQDVADAEGQIWRIWTESGSDTVDLFMRDAMTAMARGEFDQALENINTVIEMDPEFAEGWNKRATIYYLMGNFDASVGDIVHTLDLEPRHFGALAGLGLIYDQIDDPEGALKAYKRALEVHPFLPHARRRVEQLSKELKDKEI